MIRLKSVHVDDLVGTTAIYELSPGNGKTILELEFSVIFDRSGGIHAAMKVDGPVSQENVHDALDRFAEWLSRASEAIQERGEPDRELPIFNR